jgi:two-component system, OmpR family, alkaline phosphatase synthesis response regulator PhoP
MAAEKILVIEDDGDIRELIRYNLEREGYRVFLAADGNAGLDAAYKAECDLILLDLMLPGIGGIEICKRLKGDPRTTGIPIVMVTAKGEETDIVVGLELGADDYIVKPFSPRVMVARIKAVLRRKQSIGKADAGELIRFGNLEIHEGRREVHIDGKMVELTFTEFQILRFLVSRPGWVFTRYQIVDAVKGEDYPVTDRAVDVHIVGLRKKLGSYGDHIQTIRGVGYRFAEHVSEEEE